MSQPSHTIDELRDIVSRLPTTRNENWKYTDLSRARDISDRWLAAGCAVPVAEIEDEIDAITGGIDAHWLVIANGKLARRDESIDGVSVAHLDHGPSGADNALAELNAALLKDGLRIRIDGKPGKPVGLLVIDGGNQASVSQAYTEIECAPGSDTEIVEYHASFGSGEHYANSFLSLKLDANARASLVRFQDRDKRHVQTAHTAVSVGRDAILRMAGFDLGGGLIRNDLVVDLVGPGADIAFDGLYLAGDEQHIDNHTRVDHRVGPASSRQEYRGILNGKCRCVWNGKAIVHVGADGTDADQANHNLLLSDKAEIDAKPELEIYADDVKCSHGTTIGQLDESSLFYLRTRGLDKRHATQVLTHAFAADLVSRMPVEAAKGALAAIVESRLSDLIDTDLETLS